MAGTIREQCSLNTKESIPDIAASDGSSSPSRTVEEVDWTPEEEKRVVRKIDSLVLALLTLSFFALQLDRGNMYVSFQESAMLAHGSSTREY